MKYAFQPEALVEYEEAARYFTGIRRDLGARFVASIEDAIAKVAESPGSFRRFEGEIRRCLIHVFPYAILYVVEPDQILIVAVMHCRREPGYWRKRVPKGS
jgi:toxin ParE1/3/4